jgi:Mn-dependent DtxR family transcriptional regulator
VPGKDGGFRTFRGYSLRDDQSLTPSMEDYLEMLFRLTGGTKSIRLADLGAALNVQPPSVTHMIRRLADAGFVSYRKYGILALTDEGQEQGLRLLKRHELVEEFLRLLGVRENALKDTERTEHIISEELVSRITSIVSYIRDNPSWWQTFLDAFPPEDKSDRGAGATEDGIGR